ncbi:hypothetical protein E2C01_044788 [Portunus trituberculatus]|uniref:Uncharacterized protein n=1 Tax=Portunus trituberculatus TaxID=210409 RepID=A0A5B7G143_PORTR|nr:hypothetical protein [Portunus trituberculatus]
MYYFSLTNSNIFSTPGDHFLKAYSVTSRPKRDTIPAMTKEPNRDSKLVMLKFRECLELESGDVAMKTLRWSGVSLPERIYWRSFSLFRKSSYVRVVLQGPAYASTYKQVSTNTPQTTRNYAHSHGLHNTSTNISNPILPYRKLVITSGHKPSNVRRATELHHTRK